MLQNDSIINDVYQITKSNDVTMESLEEPSTGLWTSLLITFLPFILLAGFLYFMMNQETRWRRRWRWKKRYEF